MPVINLHGTPTYQGEVLLLGWSENNRDGMTVRLALDASDEGAVHPFRHLGTGKHGQRFMAVLVPVSDEPSPVPAQPEQPNGIEPQRTPLYEMTEREKRRWDDMTYAQQAGIACGEPEFWRFLTEEKCAPDISVENADEAAQSVRAWCYVGSRAELDREEAAAEHWRTLYGEYKRWRSDQVGQEQAEAQAEAYRR